jgi:Nucleotide modification associated domain 2
MHVWTYVITFDSGGAPNFEPPATTLTVCKPRIRQAAQPGDLVLAFNGARLNPAEPHSVRWAGIVSEVIPMENYWDDPRFQGKKQGAAQSLPDNIYRPTKGGFEQVKNDVHKPDALVRDCQRCECPCSGTVMAFWPDSSGPTGAFQLEDDRGPSRASTL